MGLGQLSATRSSNFSGAQVALGCFDANDVEAVHTFAADPIVCRFTGWGPNTLEESQAFVADALQRRPGRLVLAVLRDAEVIGSASVWTTDDANRVGELGYTLRRDCWGRGHGSEVARLLVWLGFNHLGLERLAATCDPGNLASIRVLEKAGLAREGMARGLYRIRGHRRDRVLLGCLREDIDALVDAAELQTPGC